MCFTYTKMIRAALLKKNKIYSKRNTQITSNGCTDKQIALYPYRILNSNENKQITV